ncbi:hypothetical protein AYL99_07000 [Fonsecaea erecta]|uniref:proline dehydrogenase n=1 Tax=Fonsecaea erecta TaxID=1367422 RepID=A0A178ZJ55_9EURO|nr:hypothetical protein AYL99_07000 [Fonsecaea erecta]OAP59702.1 hypothetical protein AYL99_07000 [Fonsecaea erecta]
MGIDKNETVAILGAGAWGLSTALHMLNAGYTNITVFDQCTEIPSPFSGAYDLNKIVRAEYEDNFYTELALEAIREWKTPFWGANFHQVGYVLATSGAAPEKAVKHLQDALLSVKDHPVFAPGITMLNEHEDFKNVYWQFSGPMRGFKGYFNRLAGYAHSSNAMRDIHQYLVGKGVKFVLGSKEGKAVRLLYNENETPAERRCIGFQAANGQIHHARRTIVCLGAWAATLLPSLGSFVVAKCWSVAHVQLSERECDYLRGIPVLNIRDLGFFFEPDPTSRLLKLCPLGAGYINSDKDTSISLPPTDSLQLPKDYIPFSDEQKLRRLLKQTLPWLAERPFVDKKMCWFADTSDSEYCIDFVPGTGDSLIVMSGDSGHGFKMMPIVGHWAVKLLEDGRQVLSRWQWKQSQGRGGKQWGDEGEPIGALPGMASLRSDTLRVSVSVRQSLRIARAQRKSHSSTHSQTVINPGAVKESSNTGSTNSGTFAAPPLARLSASSILRTLLLSAFFTSPLLFRPGFALFQKIAHSQSAWLNPDRNPLLRAGIHPLIYKQFCAGRNRTEIEQTSSEIRRLGFSGVVLCYGKEVQVEGDRFVGQNERQALEMGKEIDQWAEGNLATLEMTGQGDWLGIKYSGAGTHVTKALMKGEKAPVKFVEAMEKICQRAAAKDCRIWIDAEQQALQPSIDQWTFDLMRRYNRPGRQALIYNTVQAYLKSSRDKVQDQLQLARKQGWRLGIKLVRGAYINNDIREAIHDTKAETDASYDGIVEDLLCGKFPAMTHQESVELDLLLAGHNADTIRRAARLASKLAAQSQLKVVPEFGQLQGMADDIGCELLQMADDIKRDSSLPQANTYIPKVYKCLTWGSIQECMQYLTRRLVENRGAADRMKVGAAEFRRELLH